MAKSIILITLLLLIIISNSQAEISADLDAIVISTYQQIHANPELGNEEFKTQALIIEKLTEFGFTEFLQSQKAPTAVIAVLDSGKAGPTIALRADMDARRIQEDQNNNPRSKIDGVMHNCGHDAHTAALLGSAYYLAENRDTFTGKIVFVFQPAEEVAGGADDIVNEGILERLNVEAIFAQHVFNGLPVGTLVMSSGASLAGSNYFTLTIKGKGSHAAVPSEGSDTLVAAAKILVEFSEMPARAFHIIESPLIITPTQISSNANSSNIIPDEIVIKGTIRAFNDLFEAYNNEETIESLLKKRISGLAQAYGLNVELDIRKGSPPTINNDALYQKTLTAFRASWQGKLKLDSEKGMFSEDFSYYTKSIPALYVNFGIAKDGLGENGVHTSKFNIHPDALPYGVRALVYLAQLHTRGEITSY